MIGPIARFNTIGDKERELAATVIDGCPLSGFLGGELRGGTWVRALERQWEKVFKIKHAIACNSATSGLLAASAAVGLKAGDKFIAPTLTMSATVAAPMILGAKPILVDIEDDYFCMNNEAGSIPIFTTNLFGHVVYGIFPDNTFVIEDNSQAPFAMWKDRYAGTIGDIGIFSMNVHKHIQCGEGGIIVTNRDSLCAKLRLFINHGELAGADIGLNLRMTEVTAAIALAQLTRGQEIVAGRIKQAEKIMTAIGPLDGLIHPQTRHGCKHVYYALAFRVTNGRRDEIVNRLNNYGVPVRAGYLPLHRVPAFKQEGEFPVADRLHDHELMLFENCAYSPTDDQIDQIGQAFRKAFK